MTLDGARPVLDHDPPSLELLFEDTTKPPLRVEPEADAETWHTLVADLADHDTTKRFPALALDLRASKDDVLILLGDLRFCMLVREGGETYAGKWAPCYGAIERDELRLYSFSRPSLSMVKSPLALTRLLSAKILAETPHRFELEIADVRFLIFLTRPRPRDRARRSPRPRAASPSASRPRRSSRPSRTSSASTRPPSSRSRGRPSRRTPSTTTTTPAAGPTSRTGPPDTPPRS